MYKCKILLQSVGIYSKCTQHLSNYFKHVKIAMLCVCKYTYTIFLRDNQLSLRCLMKAIIPLCLLNRAQVQVAAKHNISLRCTFFFSQFSFLLYALWISSYNLGFNCGWITSFFFERNIYVYGNKGNFTTVIITIKIIV